MVKLNQSKILILTITFAVAIAIIFTIHPFFNISTAQQPIVKDPKLKVEVFAHGLNSNKYGIFGQKPYSGFRKGNRCSTSYLKRSITGLAGIESGC
jgi:hypothetical protein